ncbi:MAG: hypothetical protein ACR2PL_22070 [Dehalococcoidia bacterium]
MTAHELRQATRLILVEGIPGSGKSTLAQFLLRQVQGDGRQARWWYEEERDHPLYPFHDVPSLQRVVGDLYSGNHRGVIAAVLTMWRQLSEALQIDKHLVLLDGCFFGYLTWSLFAADVSFAETAEYVVEVERIVAPLRPAIIYLRTDNVAGTIRRICDRRGGQTERNFIRRATGSPYGRRLGLIDFPGLVSFWTDFRSLADALFAHSNLAKLNVDNTAGDWMVYERSVLDYLAITPVVPPQHPIAELAQFAGRYSVVQNDTETFCEVRVQDRRLYLDGVPEVWPACHLIPQTTDTFAVESLPFTVTFEADAPGVVTGFNLAGPALLAGPIDSHFRRDATTPD